MITPTDAAQLEALGEHFYEIKSKQERERAALIRVANRALELALEVIIVEGVAQTPTCKAAFAAVTAVRELCEETPGILKEAQP